MLGSLPGRVFLAAAIHLSLLGRAHAAPPIQSLPSFVTQHPGLPPGANDLASRRHGFEPIALAPQAEVSSGPDLPDVHWRPGFGLPVPDNAILSLLVHEGVLVAGGYFQRIGDMAAPGLAIWDGANWSLFDHFPGRNVMELAPLTGGFVAQGNDALWHWTGGGWETWWAPGDYPNLAAMAVQDSQVAVAAVSNAGAFRVELHTPTGWTALGGEFDNQVLALAWYGGSLYAAGMFGRVGGVDAPRVARWDGANWQPLAQPIPHNPYDWVRSLVVYRGELVAGGDFYSTLDPSLPRFFASWDGTRWAPLGMGGPQYPNLQRLRVVGDDLYALGTYEWPGPDGHGMARWDGNTWHLNEERLQVFVDDVASFQGDFYAGGFLSRNGPGPAGPLMRRHAGTWHAPVPGPGMNGLFGWNGPLVQALAVTDRGIVAAGRIDFAGTPGAWRSCQGFAIWNGSEWSPLGQDDWTFIDPYDLVVHQGELYAIGSFSSPSVGGPVLKLTDAGWTAVRGGSFPPPNLDRGVSALGALFVAGGVDPNDGFHGIARWDGSSWAPVGGGVTRGNYIDAMVQLGSELVVAGRFSEVGGVPCQNVAAWNPETGWHALGAGLSGIGGVSSLAARDGVLYASSDCGLSGGDPVSSSGIMRWRAGHWESLQPPFATAYRLGWFRGRLVASTRGTLAMLDADGTTWHRLGSGTNGAVLDMVESGSSLFVGGMFSRAGATSSYGIAEWRDETLPDLPVPSAISTSPNPSSGAVHLSYQLPTASHARVEVFDITGHRVGMVFDGQQPAGRQDVVWTPDAARVKAGVYFARVTVGANDRVVRVLRIP